VVWPTWKCQANLLIFLNHNNIHLSSPSIMKTTTALITFTILLGAGANAAVISSPHVNCYTIGPTWENVNDAWYHMSRACKGYDGKRGAFQGYFSPSETKSVCVNGPGNQKYDMSIQNLNRNAGFDLDDGDCEWRMGQINVDCVRGGEYDYAGWRFR
jgi:hypothetical protein